MATIAIAGGGTAGAAIAARLATETDARVVLLEAGPDYGPLEQGRWPADLADARTIGFTHDWGYTSHDSSLDRTLTLERARVLGGCSAHNGAVQTWGSRLDYDAWAARGNPGWSTDELLGAFDRAGARLRAWTYPLDAATPYQRAVYDAAIAVGLPRLETVNDLDEGAGVAMETVNIVDGVRFNSAFAYVDAARDHSNLEVMAEVTVDRVVCDGGRVVGIEGMSPGGAVAIAADVVIVAAGAFGSPGILLRSGIGDAAEVADLDIELVHDLPGVGRNLHDHPFYVAEFAGSATLATRMREFEAARGWSPDEQVMIKARSSRSDGPFDLHVLPWSLTEPEGGRRWFIATACLTPQSRGSVTLAGPNVDDGLVIDHRFLSDPDGHDIAVLRDGARLIRRLAGAVDDAGLLGDEILPSPTTADAELDAHIRATASHYYHPVGTCAMGPPGDAAAVVDARCAVHGVAGLYVADASVIPVVPRATTAMPVSMLAERFTDLLLERLTASDK